jgi:hypothetical protein
MECGLCLGLVRGSQAKKQVSCTIRLTPRMELAREAGVSQYLASIRQLYTLLGTNDSHVTPQKINN